LFKRPVPEPVVAVDSLGFPPPDRGIDDARDTAELQAAPAISDISQDTVQGAPEDTVVVTSELYQYGFSTRGGRLISAKLADYTYTIDSLKGHNVELMHPESDLLALRLIVGRDTLHLDDWVFVPTAERVTVDRPARLGLSATRGGVTVTLDYRFEPGTYQVGAWARGWPTPRKTARKTRGRWGSSPGTAGVT